MKTTPVWLLPTLLAYSDRLVYPFTIIRKLTNRQTDKHVPIQVRSKTVSQESGTGSGQRRLDVPDEQKMYTSEDGLSGVYYYTFQ